MTGYRHARSARLVPSPVVFRPDNAFLAARPSYREILDTFDRYIVMWKQDVRSFYHIAYDRWIDVGHLSVVPDWIVYGLWISFGLLIVFAVFITLLRHRVRARTRELQLRNDELLHQNRIEQ